MMLDKILNRIDRNLQDAGKRLIDFLKIPSISTDIHYEPEIRKAARWLVDELQDIGIPAEIRETGGYPVVFAATPARSGKKRVLFYGHYDVQPVDPLELWINPPFDAKLGELPDGRKAFLARGASDDKGQIMTFIEALRAFKQEGGEFPVDVTFLIEGAEEDGSQFLPEYIAAHKEELKADIAMVCDSSRWDEDTPCINTSLRGLLYREVIIRCANRDLHSGDYGGTAQNPIHILSQIIADLHDENGHITIPGFYDGIEEPPAEILEQWKMIALNAEEFLGPVGLKDSCGEKDRLLIEQMQSRPTCDANGIIGGYTGVGTKTVIPAEARSKISFRLVVGQDADKISTNFEHFVKERVPQDCSAEIIDYTGGDPVELPYDMPELAVAGKALQDEWKKEPVLVGVGGSIPVVSDFKNILGLNTLLVGFALSDDRIHSPNEKYDVKSFHKGMRSWARILAEFS